MGRASGTYISPNNFAGFLGMLLPLATAYILVGRMKPVVRVLLGYAALVMAGGDGGDLFARRLGGGRRWRSWFFWELWFFTATTGCPRFCCSGVLAGGGMVFVTQYLSKTFSYIHRVETDLQGQAGERL